MNLKKISPQNQNKTILFNCIKSVVGPLLFFYLVKLFMTIKQWKMQTISHYAIYFDISLSTIWHQWKYWNDIFCIYDHHVSLSEYKTQNSRLNFTLIVPLKSQIKLKVLAGATALFGFCIVLSHNLQRRKYHKVISWMQTK